MNFEIQANTGLLGQYGLYNYIFYPSKKIKTAVK